jgi:antitoxin PrlF
MSEATVSRSTLREKGQMTLPASVREALRVEAGDEIEFAVVANGEVVMRGLKMIPADQAWFWSESWQRGEREASADIAAGRVETFTDAESFFDFIETGGA